MAIFHFNEDADTHSDEIQLGYCENCQQFHLTAGPMTLSFEVPELAEFLNSAMEVYWEQALRGTMQMPDLQLPAPRFAMQKPPAHKRPQNARTTKGALL